MIRRLLLCAAMIACVSCRQNPSSLRLSGPTSSPGSTAWNVELQDSQKLRPTAIQWSFYYSPSAVTQVSVMEETQLRSAAKHLECSSAIGRTTCIVWGGDAAAISGGTLARAEFALNRNNAHPSAVISLRDVEASSRQGTALPLGPTRDYPSPAAQLPNAFLTWAHARYADARSTVKHLYHRR